MSIDLQEFMWRHDDITAAFHTLPLPCPFCGRTVSIDAAHVNLNKGCE